jgi:hypothetical protein
MKKVFISCVLLLLTTSFAVAQNNAKAAAERKPNLSGVWVPQDERQRKPDAGPDGWLKVIIEEHDPSLKVSVKHSLNSKTQDEEFYFYTDQRGETNHRALLANVSANDQKLKEEVKSKTRWEGNVLVMTYALVAHDGLMTLNMELTMRWQLSADAQTLIRTTKITVTSAKVLKKTADGEKEEDLPLSNRKDTVYTDVFFLLDDK